MKQKLKDKVSEKREALSNGEVKEKSSKIRENLFSLPELKDAKNVLFYVSFNNEVNTIGMIKELLINGEKNIIVPFVEKGNPILQLSGLKDFNELEPKTYGILEPKEGKIKKFNINNLDLVIVPGVAFDKSGHRIGYGFGYYDRFLKKLSKDAIKIGLCYDFQLIDKIPEEKHDVPMDIVVTERKVFKAINKF